MALPTLPAMMPSKDSPWWVNFLYTFGVPAGIALYLIYNITNGQAKALDVITKTVEAHSVASHVEADIAAASRNRTEVYMRLLCVNTAKSSDQQNSCLSVR